MKPEDTGVHIYNIKNKQVTTLPASRGIAGPVLSPDGRYIAATKTSGDRMTLLFDTQTQSWSSLVGIRGIPRWSHDSKCLFYLPMGDEPAIMKIRVSDHHTEKVADLTQMRVTGGLAGVQFLLSPEDSPILLKDTGTQEIYSVALRPH
jgi:WD40 repeat protein